MTGDVDGTTVAAVVVGAGRGVMVCVVAAAAAVAAVVALLPMTTRGSARLEALRRTMKEMSTGAEGLKEPVGRFSWRAKGAWGLMKAPFCIALLIVVW